MAFGPWKQASVFNFEQKEKIFLILWCLRETSRQLQEDRQVVSTDHPIPILENSAMQFIFLRLHSREHIGKVSSPGKLWASSTAQIFVGEDYTPGQPAAAECCKHTKKTRGDTLKTAVKPIIFAPLVYLNNFKDKEQSTETIYNNLSC